MRSFFNANDEVVRRIRETFADDFIRGGNGGLFLRLFKNADDVAAGRGVCDLGGAGDGINSDFSRFFMERSDVVANDFRNCADNLWHGVVEFEGLIGGIFMGNRGKCKGNRD